LASNKVDLDFIKNSLVKADPQLEDRIVGEFDCIKALKISSPEFKVKFIYPGDDPECVTKGIYNLCLSSSCDKDIRVVLEGDFPSIGQKEKLMVFEHKTRLIKIKKKHFENVDTTRKIINTLFKAPPVYVSYRSNDEMNPLLKKMAISFGLVFPHIDIKYDRKDVHYKGSISKYIEKLVQARNIIFLINREYLKSEHCMAEFLGVYNADITLLKNRIHPMVASSANFIYSNSKLSELVQIERYWMENQREISESKKNTVSNVLKDKLDIQLKFISDVIGVIPNLSDIIKELYGLPFETYEDSNFFDVFWAINQQLTEDGYISLYSNEEEMKEVLVR